MTKPFLPTYLYVKTHNVTGLKYFGKTTRDPCKYRGSGTYWVSHLKIHGNNVSTEIIGYFTDKDECATVAIKFSQDNNIVHAVNENNKKTWANQIEENGTDGGITRVNFTHSDETRKKIGAAHKGKKIDPGAIQKAVSTRRENNNLKTYP